MTKGFMELTSSEAVVIDGGSFFEDMGAVFGKWIHVDVNFWSEVANDSAKFWKNAGQDWYNYWYSLGASL